MFTRCFGSLEDRQEAFACCRLQMRPSCDRLKGSKVGINAREHMAPGYCAAEKLRRQYGTSYAQALIEALQAASLLAASQDAPCHWLL